MLKDEEILELKNLFGEELKKESVELSAALQKVLNRHIESNHYRKAGEYVPKGGWSAVLKPIYQLDISYSGFDRELSQESDVTKNDMLLQEKVLIPRWFELRYSVVLINVLY